MIQCPDCGSRVKQTKNHLTDEEYTWILQCVLCEFSIETISNLAATGRKPGPEGGQ